MTTRLKADREPGNGAGSVAAGGVHGGLVSRDLKDPC